MRTSSAKTRRMPYSHADAVARRAAADQLDLEIRHWLRQKRSAKAEVVMRVERMETTRLWEFLGCRSINAYTRKLAGWSASTTSKVIALARAVGDLPLLRAAFFEGELGWTVCYLVSTIATPETEAEWLETARTKNREELADSIARAKGEPVKRQRTFDMSLSQHAKLEAGIAAVMKEKPELDRDAAFEVLCDRGATGAGGTHESRTVIFTCSDCKKAVRQGPGGLIPVEPAELEQHACDTEFLDIREGPAASSRAVPTKVREYVFARDFEQCRFPDCTKTTELELHHEGGWEMVGHDPESCYVACKVHHGVRHRGGFVVLKLGRGQYRFQTVPGVDGAVRIFGDVDLRLPAKDRKRFKKAVLKSAAEADDFPGETKGRVVSDDVKGSAVTDAVKTDVVKADAKADVIKAALVKDAVKVLVGLELKVTHAKQLVADAVGRLALEEQTVEAIVTHVLRTMPLRL